jgi:8-oxo-dGTP diphosphatase
MREEFRVVVNAVTTHRGKILLGKKEEKEGHPISGEWHFPGGHIDQGEEPEEAVKREIKQETGLEVEVHQIVDVTSNTGSDYPFQVIYHAEADSEDAEAQDDLTDVKWVEPGDVKEEIGDKFSDQIDEREELKRFIERIEKAPY